jgi:hypothetical protein
VQCPQSERRLGSSVPLQLQAGHPPYQYQQADMGAGWIRLPISDRQCSGAKARVKTRIRPTGNEKLLHVVLPSLNLNLSGFTLDQSPYR